jgi:hypothetical protein
MGCDEIKQFNDARRIHPHLTAIACLNRSVQIAQIDQSDRKLICLQVIAGKRADGLSGGV